MDSLRNQLCLLTLLLQVLVSLTVASINRRAEAVSFARPGQPRCINLPDALELKQPSHDNTTDVPCHKCVRMSVFRCPSVRNVNLEQCNQKVAPADVWKGFAHVLVCEVLWNNVKERLVNGSSNVSNATRHAILRAAIVERPLNGSVSGRSDPYTVKPFATLNLSRGVERFDVDEEKLRVALLLNPESFSREPSALFKCGILVESQNNQNSPPSNSIALESTYEYVRHDIEILLFKQPPEFPSASCRMDLDASHGAQLRCSINVTRSQPLRGQWLLEWCQFRCSGECSRCPFSPASSSTSSMVASVGSLGTGVELQESCVISGAEHVAILLVPRLLRVVSATGAAARVVDEYSPNKTLSILHLHPVVQLLAEAVSPSTVVLTWEDYKRLPPMINVEFCVQLSPPRARSAHTSASGAPNALSSLSKESLQVESECFEHTVGSLEMIIHTIADLHPYTNYAFSVSARVRGEPHWSPAASASAITKETAALVNPILRVPLVERFAGESDDFAESSGRQVRVFWENPSNEELGGRLIETIVKWSLSNSLKLIQLELIQRKSPFNWASWDIPQGNNNLTVVLSSYTSYGTNQTRPATQITLAPELELLRLDNICWISLRQQNRSSQSDVVVDEIQVEATVGKLTFQDTLEASTVLCTRSMNGPCVIQHGNNNGRIYPYENEKSLVSSVLLSNIRHERLDLSDSDGQLRVGVALSKRSGYYSALTFETCDSRALGLTQLEGDSQAQKGCGLFVNLKVLVTKETVVVTWSVSRCTISGRRPLEYRILIEKPTRERSSANIGNLESERLVGFGALLLEECGLTRFPRDKITERELYYTVVQQPKHDCTHSYSHKVNTERFKVGAVIITLGARLEDNSWLVKRERADIELIIASNSWTFILSALVLISFVLIITCLLVLYFVCVLKRRNKNAIGNSNNSLTNPGSGDPLIEEPAKQVQELEIFESKDEEDIQLKRHLPPRPAHFGNDQVNNKCKSTCETSERQLIKPAEKGDNESIKSGKYEYFPSSELSKCLSSPISRQHTMSSNQSGSFNQNEVAEDVEKDAGGGVSDKQTKAPREEGLACTSNGEQLALGNNNTAVVIPKQESTKIRQNTGIFEYQDHGGENTTSCTNYLGAKEFAV